MRDGDGPKYFLTDYLGSVMAVLSDTGTLIGEQRYLPFGQVREDIGAITHTLAPADSSRQILLI
jgi:hypothetical protein